MQLPTPYLLFLGDVDDPLAIKMARGVSVWRPDLCIGQLRLSSRTPSLGIADMSIPEAAEHGAKTLVIGLTNPGGTLPSSWLETLHKALQQRMNIANGMHVRLNMDRTTAKLAGRCGVRLFDLRSSEQGFEVGNGRPRTGNRVLTVGTDCSVGKMYTALSLEAEMKQRRLNVDFRATGQTGVLIAGQGVAIDAVVADFISGAVESIAPANTSDHWDIIEGQGSLFHPAYAGVSLGLLHGAQAHSLVMCHELGREHIRHLAPRRVPSLAECVEANLRAARVTNPGARLAGFSINTASAAESEAEQYCATLEARFGVPATDPMRFGVRSIVDRILGAAR